MPRRLDPNKYKDLLTFLRSFFETKNFAPSYEEIVKAIGLSSKCQVKPYLEWLIDDGMLEREPGKARTLRLTQAGRGVPRLRPRVAGYVSKMARINAAVVERIVQLPVIGRTVAGEAVAVPNGDFSIYDQYSTIEVNADVLPPRANLNHYFVLEVKGESMIEAGIVDGDFIICRQSEIAQKNDMVVVLLPDTNETTLKYYIPEPELGHIRLQPANSTMAPILIPLSTRLMIRGVVVQVVHCAE